MRTIEAICMDAKMASRPLAGAGAEQKNRFLDTLANWLVLHQDRIIAENALDVQDAKKDELSEALVDRLTLTAERISGMADDLRHLINLSDPVGEVFERSITEQGLKVRKQHVPLGVLAVIYESRPNVTVDVAALAIKSGNAIILRGGKETIRSNQVLVSGIHSALAESALPPAAVQFVSEPDRSHVEELLKMHDHIDMLIPRGGAALHRYCRENSSIPVITGGIGICHLFVDQSADLAPSLQVIRNAKVQRPTVCNALDTVLVHRAIAADLIPRLIAVLGAEGVAFRLDERTMDFADGIDTAAVSLAGPDDFDTEWLSLVLGIKVVDGMDEAIEHISLHSTHHSDGILTQDKYNAERFTALVDSAAVYVNASTRFTDGSQLGLGAEVAISTQRLHARGPMALRELTTYKWVIEGDYTTRA